MKKVVLAVALCCPALVAAQGGGAPGNPLTPAPGAQAAPAAPGSGQENMRSQMPLRTEQQSQQEMRAQLDVMKRKVSLMRSEALSIADSHARDAINTDADLWQQLIAGMEKHLEQMQRMQSPAAPAPPAPR